MAHVHLLGYIWSREVHDCPLVGQERSPRRYALHVGEINKEVYLFEHHPSHKRQKFSAWLAGWTWLSIFPMRAATHSGLTLRFTKPGPASVGSSARMGVAGRFSTIACPAALGFFGAPSCRQIIPLGASVCMVRRTSTAAPILEEGRGTGKLLPHLALELVEELHCTVALVVAKSRFLCLH